MVSKGKMVTGVVKWFDPRRKYGYIERSDGKADVFVHLNDVVDDGWLQERDRVQFFVVEAPKGPRAISVQHLWNHHRPAKHDATRQSRRVVTESRTGRSSFSYTIYPRGYTSTRRGLRSKLTEVSNSQNQE